MDNYCVIQFKLISPKVIEQIKDILNRFGVKTTKIGKSSNSFVLRVTDQKEVHKFISLIKPNNPWNIERYLKT